MFTIYQLLPSGFWDFTSKYVEAVQSLQWCFFMKAWVYFWVDFGEIASWVYDVFYTQHSDRHQLGIHAYRLAVCGIKPCHFEITEAISILIETIKSDIR
jgi:hypothetical protein